MSESEQVLQANRRFYEALGALDLEQMSDVWLQAEFARCVHPGWAMLEGWEEIRESWRRIFENTQSMRVHISSASVTVEAPIAWVCCVERIDSSGEGRIDSAYVQATNIFVWRDGQWRMILHHASHIPAPARPGLGEETIQ